jgi:hypothetical protein
MSFDQLVQEIEKLTPAECAGLVDVLIERMADNIDPEIERAQLDEVARRRREATTFIPAEEVFRDVRKILEE